jgi:DNA-binding MarR family transcriptional regulator
MDEARSIAPIGARMVQIIKIHRRWVAEQLEPLGLHIGQELLLMRLCRTEGVRQTALAEGLGIEPPTVNRMLARLEAAGFVERREDPDDARATLTFLTPRGRRTCARIREIWREAEVRLREALSPDDAAELERILDGLARRLVETQSP